MSKINWCDENEWMNGGMMRTRIRRRKSKDPAETEDGRDSRDERE
jgi:hypothetical protein